MKNADRSLAHWLSTHRFRPRLRSFRLLVNKVVLIHTETQQSKASRELLIPRTDPEFVATLRPNIKTLCPPTRKENESSKIKKKEESKRDAHQKEEEKMFRVADWPSTTTHHHPFHCYTTDSSVSIINFHMFLEIPWERKVTNGWPGYSDLYVMV